MGREQMTVDTTIRLSDWSDSTVFRTLHILDNGDIAVQRES